MSTLTLATAAVSAALVFAAFHAWRLGNERRDVALLGCAAGANALVAWIAPA